MSAIAPFEHPVGAHGGLGGAQTKAFLFYPADLQPSDDPVAVVGAEGMRRRGALAGGGRSAGGRGCPDRPG